MKHEENPFNKQSYIGRRSRYIPVEGLFGVTDDGEKIRDNVFIKREQIYDKKKFAKLYIDNIHKLYPISINGWKVFIIIVMEMGVKVDYLWITWKKEYGISRSGFSRGIKDLLDVEMIAKSEQKGKYWINLNFVNRG